jgi:hypothetical protein
MDQLGAQRAFESAFYELAGQGSVVDRLVRPPHHYSSSLSVEVLANYLRAQRFSVGLLHPTFDNIAPILSRHAVPLTAVSEAIFDDPPDEGHHVGCDAIFLVAPNNPTGADPSPATLSLKDSGDVKCVMCVPGQPPVR